MDLPQALARMTRVTVVRGAVFDPRRRRNNEVLARLDDDAFLADLRVALRVGDTSEEAAWAMTGDPTFALHAADAYLGCVSLLGVGWLRSELLPWDAPLREPDHLATWLERHVQG
jgi:hypothetical protein